MAHDCRTITRGADSTTCRTNLFIEGQAIDRPWSSNCPKGGLHPVTTLSCGVEGSGLPPGKILTDDPRESAFGAFQKRLAPVIPAYGAVL